MTAAVEYAQNAFVAVPRMGEAYFQAAKATLYLGDVDAAMTLIRQAIACDIGYARRVALDGEFRRHGREIGPQWKALAAEIHQRVKAASDVADDVLARHKHWDRVTRQMVSFLADAMSQLPPVETSQICLAIETYNDLLREVDLTSHHFKSAHIHTKQGTLYDLLLAELDMRSAEKHAQEIEARVLSVEEMIVSVTRTIRDDLRTIADNRKKARYYLLTGLCVGNVLTLLFAVLAMAVGGPFLGLCLSSLLWGTGIGLWWGYGKQRYVWQHARVKGTSEQALSATVARLEGFQFSHPGRSGARRVPPIRE
jgi:hypothetical protein